MSTPESRSVIEDKEGNEYVQIEPGRWVPADSPELRQDISERRHNISESADKIQVKWSCKRGSETRDEDRFDVKVKGDSPREVADRLQKLQEEVKHDLMPRAREVLHEEEESEDA